jgi:hydrogenase-4 component F
MLWALVLVPTVGAAIALAIPSNHARPWVVPAVGAAHAATFAAALRWAPPPTPGAWLALDPLATLVLGQISAVYLLCSCYAPGYLQFRAERDNRVFCAAFSLVLGAMSLAVTARNLGLLWVGVEAATLVGARLVYFNHNRRSIEATWKYLLVGGVGVAIALLGSFFLAYASLHARLPPSLAFDDLAANAAVLSKPWLRAAVVLLFVGYGTKMGLAPMHTWKPDAYGETPGIVGTVFAGAMTSCAFVAMLRAYQIAALAGDGPFARQLLVALGLVSMAVAAVFVVGQNDFKRMLAYSSVEHMGILALGVGLGGLGTFGALFHLLTNAFTKGVLFLAAGNIHRAYRSKLASEVTGALSTVPVSGALFLAGFFAATGAPPFGPFFSELIVLAAAISSGRFVVATLFLALLLVVFVGMGSTVLPVVQGEPPADASTSSFREELATTAPILAFLAVSLLLGLYLPGWLRVAIEQAAAHVEGR